MKSVPIFLVRVRAIALLNRGQDAIAQGRLTAIACSTDDGGVPGLKQYHPVGLNKNVHAISGVRNTLLDNFHATGGGQAQAFSLSQRLRRDVVQLSHMHASISTALLSSIALNLVQMVHLNITANS